VYPPEIAIYPLLNILFAFLGQVFSLCIDAFSLRSTVEKNDPPSTIEHTANGIFELNLVIFELED